MLWKRRSQKNRHSSHKRDMCELRKTWSLASRVSESDSTCIVTDEPAPEAVVAEVWCVAVDDGRCDRIEHPVSAKDMKLCQVSTNERRCRRMFANTLTNHSSHKHDIVGRSKFTEAGHERDQHFQIRSRACSRIRILGARIWITKKGSLKVLE